MPAGGGVVKIGCMPVAKLTPVQMLDFGKVASVQVHVLFCGKAVTQNLADQTAAAALQLIRPACPGDVQVEQSVAVVAPLAGAPSNFLCVSVTIRTSSGRVLQGNAMDHSKSPPVARLAENACHALIADIQRGACLDEHCSDQVIIFMALAPGCSAFRTGPLTEHTRTAIHFAQVCTGAEFEVVSVPGSKDLFEVRCNGIGWQRC
eukprot:gnl/MRDRNA2_/MRDRNA2_168508_c0_seq1.p1 gnl/MRDRNA2_/MRDRNA2_168508_c0~~gnl/MRDRNA2_/MRDRNA2_168508_c0_seq1.p1  ORF type:complete len:228 (+),score=36.61 gnl/MRDRNA2_/MRDRNA2_168508_c0_seq1:70-684(+)